MNMKVQNKCIAEMHTASEGIRTRAEKILVSLGMRDQYLNHWSKENSR